MKKYLDLRSFMWLMRWYIVLLFAFFYRALFSLIGFSVMVVPTFWGVKLILPMSGFSRYSVLQMMTGVYEPEWSRAFSYFIRRAKILIDVGAAADGYYSIRACLLNKNIKVIALEPLKSEYLWFIYNLKMNGLLTSVLPLKLALGKENGEVAIDSEVVPVVSLDTLVSRLKLNNVDVIKVDVEGAGLDIVEGGINTISRYRPVVFFEIHNDNERKVIGILKSLGYTVMEKPVGRVGRVIAIPNITRG